MSDPLIHNQFMKGRKIMQEQKVRAIMKRIATCLLVLSLMFTMAGNGTFAAYADASRTALVGTLENDDGTGGPTQEEIPPGEDGDNNNNYEPYYPVLADYIGYYSLKEAIDAIAQKENKSGTIVIRQNIDEDVVIPANTTISIDLQGYTITNASDHTIINYGTLVIKDSSYAKTGTVDNVTDQKAAIINEAGAEVTIEAGTITRSKETGIGFSIKGDNSYNTIINQGTLTIGENASVTQGPKGGGYSHLICNGWRSNADNNINGTAKITINGGTLSGGLTNIENYHFGEVDILGGTFEDAEYNSICNYNIANIEDGTFSVRAGKNASVLYNQLKDDDTAVGRMNVKGGFFTGNIQNVSGDTKVTGGTFTNIVENEFIPDGYIRQKLDSGNFTVIEGTGTGGDASLSIGSSGIGSSALDIISPGSSKNGIDNAVIKVRNDLNMSVTSGNIMPSESDIRSKLESILNDENVDSTSKTIISEIVSSDAASKNPVTGLKKAFNTEKFLSSGLGDGLLNAGAQKIDINLNANLSKVNLTVKASLENNELKLKLVPKSISYEVHPEVIGLKNNEKIGESVSLKEKNSEFLNGSDMQFSLPVPSDVDEKYVKIIHQSEGNENEVSYSEIFVSGNNKFTNVRTSHYSTFELEFVDKEEIIADQKAEIKKVKAAVTLSTKNVKKGIKVTVKVPASKKSFKTGVIIYRSQKKSSGYVKYKNVKTSGSTYTVTNTKNSKGKRLTKGRRYYYKARAYIVINGKPYYGPMSGVKSKKAK